MAVNAAMPDDLAYQITKTMFEKREDLARIHAEGGNIKIEQQTLKRSGIPFHPGALRYFKEKGVSIE
jgi:uncharacterized protein